MSIIDSHCHAWATWPYSPVVPDRASRGRVEQLLYEMDANEVEQAVLICAQITHNPENNAYVAEQVARHPHRLHQFVDVDSFWSPTYHTAGAAERLSTMAERWPIKGFTHYVAQDDDGAWLTSDEGRALFRTAADRQLIASIHCQPHQQAAIRKLAAQFPSVPILLHHLGHVKATEAAPYPALQQILASAKLPNIYIKLSGFAYATQVTWDFPYTDTHRLIQAEYEHYGPQRMCWGSDYPVVRRFMTYRQALEAFRTHCDFIPPADRELILGQSLAKLLNLGSHL